MNYYTYHIGDYRTATAHLSLEEDATYSRLLDLQYDREAALPNDIPMLARRVRSTEAMVKAILTEFFTLSDGGWENKRVTEEVARHHQYIAKQRDAGKKSAYRRTVVQPKSNDRSTSVQPALNEASTSVEPVLNQKSTSVEGSSTSVQPPITQYPIPNTQKKEIVAVADLAWEGLPEVLDTIPFRTAWMVFIDYRKARKKPLTTASYAAKWKQMAEWGHDKAIEAIQTAIGNGWQGIFQPDHNQSTATASKSEENSKYSDAF